MILVRTSPARRRLLKRVLILAICAIAVDMPVRGRAYQEFGVSVGGKTIKMKWNRMPVSYYVSNSTAPGVSAAQLQATVATSFATWNTWRRPPSPRSSRVSPTPSRPRTTGCRCSGSCPIRPSRMSWVPPTG